MADREYNVIYRAIADYTNIVTESAKAEAATKRLGDAHGATADKVAAGETKVNKALDEHIKRNKQLAASETEVAKATEAHRRAEHALAEDFKRFHGQSSAFTVDPAKVRAQSTVLAQLRNHLRDAGKDIEHFAAQISIANNKIEDAQRRIASAQRKLKTSGDLRPGPGMVNLQREIEQQQRSVADLNRQLAEAERRHNELRARTRVTLTRPAVTATPTAVPDTADIQRAHDAIEAARRGLVEDEAALKKYTDKITRRYGARSAESATTHGAGADLSANVAASRAALQRAEREHTALSTPPAAPAASQPAQVNAAAEARRRAEEKIAAQRAADRAREAEERRRASQPSSNAATIARMQAEAEQKRQAFKADPQKVLAEHAARQRAEQEAEQQRAAVRAVQDQQIADAQAKRDADPLRWHSVTKVRAAALQRGMVFHPGTDRQATVIATRPVGLKTSVHLDTGQKLSYKPSTEIPVAVPPDPNKLESEIVQRRTQIRGKIEDLEKTYGKDRDKWNNIVRSALINQENALHRAEQALTSVDPKRLEGINRREEYTKEVAARNAALKAATAGKSILPDFRGNTITTNHALRELVNKPALAGLEDRGAVRPVWTEQLRQLNTLLKGGPARVGSRTQYYEPMVRHLQEMLQHLEKHGGALEAQNTLRGALNVYRPAATVRGKQPPDPYGPAPLPKPVSPIEEKATAAEVKKQVEEVLTDESFINRIERLRPFTETGPNYNRGVVDSLTSANRLRRSGNGNGLGFLLEAETAAGIRPREDLARHRAGEHVGEPWAEGSQELLRFQLERAKATLAQATDSTTRSHGADRDNWRDDDKRRIEALEKRVADAEKAARGDKPWTDEHLPVDQLKAERIKLTGQDQRRIDELAAQMRAAGGYVGQPVQREQTNKGTIVTDGHHRLAAAEQLGITHVPSRTYANTPEGRAAATRAMAETEHAKAAATDDAASTKPAVAEVDTAEERRRRANERRREKRQAEKEAREAAARQERVDVKAETPSSAARQRDRVGDEWARRWAARGLPAPDHAPGGPRALPAGSATRRVEADELHVKQLSGEQMSLLGVHRGALAQAQRFFSRGPHKDPDTARMLRETIPHARREPPPGDSGEFGERVTAAAGEAKAKRSRATTGSAEERREQAAREKREDDRRARQEKMADDRASRLAAEEDRRAAARDKRDDERAGRRFAEARKAQEDADKRADTRQSRRTAEARKAWAEFEKRQDDHHSRMQQGPPPRRAAGRGRTWEQYEDERLHRMGAGRRTRSRVDDSHLHVDRLAGAEDRLTSAARRATAALHAQHAITGLKVGSVRNLHAAEERLTAGSHALAAGVRKAVAAHVEHRAALGAGHGPYTGDIQDQINPSRRAIAGPPRPTAEGEFSHGGREGFVNWRQAAAEEERETATGRAYGRDRGPRGYRGQRRADVPGMRPVRESYTGRRRMESPGMFDRLATSVGELRGYLRRYGVTGARRAPEDYTGSRRAGVRWADILQTARFVGRGVLRQQSGPGILGREVPAPPGGLFEQARGYLRRYAGAAGTRRAPEGYTGGRRMDEPSLFDRARGYLGRYQAGAGGHRAPDYEGRRRAPEDYEGSRRAGGRLGDILQTARFVGRGVLRQQSGPGFLGADIPTPAGLFERARGYLGRYSVTGARRAPEGYVGARRLTGELDGVTGRLRAFGEQLRGTAEGLGRVGRFLRAEGGQRLAGVGRVGRFLGQEVRGGLGQLGARLGGSAAVERLRGAYARVASTVQGLGRVTRFLGDEIRKSDPLASAVGRLGNAYRTLGGHIQGAGRVARFLGQEFVKTTHLDTAFHRIGQAGEKAFNRVRESATKLAGTVRSHVTGALHRVASDTGGVLFGGGGRGRGPGGGGGGGFFSGWGLGPKEDRSAGRVGMASLVGFKRIGESTAEAIGASARAFRRFIAIGAAIIAVAGPVVAVLGAIGGAAIGVASAAGSMAGAVLALPGLFAAAASAVGALAIALSPMAAVFKAYSAHQDAVRKGSLQLAQSQRVAANAQRNAQHSYEVAARGIQQAQFQEARAQMALNDARREASRNLQDLRNEMDRLNLNEEGAILALKRAQAEYRKVMADGNSTLLDRQEALHAVKEAEFDKRDVLLKNKRTTEDAALAEKRGVEGSVAVVDARNAASQATIAVSDAVYQLAEAQRNLTQATKENTAGGTEAYRTYMALQDELNKLGPKTRQFAVSMLDAGDLYHDFIKRVGDSFFGPLVKQTDKIKAQFAGTGGISKMLEGAGAAMGDVASKAIDMITAWDKSGDLGKITDLNTKLISNFGDAALAVADAFDDITIAAGPFTTWISEAVKGLAQDFADWAKAGRGDGSIAAFLDDTKRHLQTLGDIIGNLWTWLTGMYTASKGFTDWILAGIDDATKRWADFATAATGGKNGFTAYLEKSKPLLSDIWRLFQAVGDAFTKIAADPANIKEAQGILTTLSERVLPALVRMFHDLASSGAVSTIVDLVASLLESIANFLDKGGTLPIEAFLKGMLWFFGGLAKLASVLPGVPEALTGIGIALGIIAAASVSAKFLGLFKLVGAFQWILANKGRIFTGLLDAILGGKATAAGRVGTVGSTGALVGQYTAQLDVIIGLLDKIAIAQGVGGLATKAAGGAAVAEGAVAGRVAAGGAAAGTAGVGAAAAGTAEAGAAAAGTAEAGAVAAGGAAAAGGAGMMAAIAPWIIPIILAVLATRMVAGSFSYDIKPDTKLLGRDLNSYGQTGKATGEASRVFGKNDEDLKYDLGTLNSGWKAKTGNWIADKIEWATNTGGDFDQSLQHAQERLTGYDNALADMVKNGNAAGAAKAFGRLTEVAKAQGTTVEDLKKGLPGYTDALKSVPPEVQKQIEKDEALEQVLRQKGLPTTDAMKDAINTLSSSTATAAEKTDAFRSAWDQVSAPELKVETSGLDYSDKFDDYKKTMQDQLAASGKQGVSLDKNTKQGRNNRRMLLDLLTASKDLYLSDREAAKGDPKAEQAAKDRYTDRQKKIEDMTGAVKQSQTEVGTLITMVGTVDQIEAAVHVNTGEVDAAIGKVNTLATVVAGVNGTAVTIKPGVQYGPTKAEADQAKADAGKTPWNDWGTLWKNFGIGGEGIRDIWDPYYTPTYKRKNRASGGFVEGTYDGQADTKAHMLTVGEFVMRRRVGESPAGKQLLEALNNEQITPEQLYGALNVSAKAAIMPTNYLPAAAVSNVAPTTVTNNNTTNRGLNLRDITINNPIRERSDRSMRRTLASVASLGNR